MLQVSQQQLANAFSAKSVTLIAKMTSQGGVTTSRNNAGCRMCRLEIYSELNGIEPTLPTTNLEQKVS